MAKNEDEGVNGRRKHAWMEILKLAVFLAVLAFLAWNAFNYANWAKEKEAERLTPQTQALPGK